MSFEPPPSLRHVLIGGSYSVGRHLGSGGFGDIFIGTNALTRKQVAVKLEHKKFGYNMLYIENRVYKTLQGGIGIPHVLWFGSEGHYHILVMELLGPSLQALFSQCSRRFSIKTVLMVGIQILNCIEFIHAKNILHGDISPNNILMGSGSDSFKLYMVDFGLAKEFRDGNTNEHVRYIKIKSPATTVFGSINRDMGFQQSRRDDLESIGYVLIYLLAGKLPWRDSQAVSEKKLIEKKKEKKMSASVEEACDTCPTEFAKYLNYCRQLSFNAAPKYFFLRNLFQNLFDSLQFHLDYSYDWVPPTPASIIPPCFHNTQ